MKNNWKSTAYKNNLYQRALLINKIRNFFFQNNILEVETPILTKHTITDLNLFPFKVYSEKKNKICKPMWLITSPEYHMKRLLASGIGFPIYQICHVFRSEEIGKYHNPEFSLLEWYQPGYNMFDMMDAINYFLKSIINTKDAQKISYQNLFMDFFSIDPLNTNFNELKKILINLNHQHLIFKNISINHLLELIFLIGIEPNIGKESPIFVYHYPADQALLSKINFYNDLIADRFELFFQGLELGNGFYELIDSIEQRKRFIQENNKRISFGFSKRVLDSYFLDSLSSNCIPDCSGVAIGLDRIIMLALKANNIDEILSFSFKNC